jgi:hypothetical protein
MKTRGSFRLAARWLFACLVLVVSGWGCSGDPGDDSPSDDLALEATAQYRAGDTIQAEALSSRSSPNPKLENNSTTLGFFDAGTWFCFDNVDMSGVTGLDLRIAAQSSGGVFSVRVGSSSGTELGRHTVTATGGWGTWATRTMTLAATSGVQTLCLRGETNAGILNLDWIKLNGTATRYRANDTVQVEALTSSSTPNPKLENGNTTLGFFDAGTWFCFDGVDMTGVTGLDLRMAAQGSGGVFSVRVGSSSGTELGRHTVTATGGWTTWATRTVSLSSASGVSSLCLRGESGAGIMNLDYFKLNSAPAARYALNSTIQVEAFTSKSSPNPQLQNSNTTLGFFDAGTWFCFDSVDLTGVTNLEFVLAAQYSGGVFSVRLDSSSGAEVGRHTVSATGAWSTWQTRNVAVSATSGTRTLCIRGETNAGICNLDSIKLTAAATTPSSGDIVGKVSVGYQGWFTAPNDGSGVNPPWWHWTPNRENPTATNIGIKSWPDMGEYTKTYATGFANLGNGKPATLFSSYDATTVDTHLRWMQENEIDTAAIQRFGDFMDVRDTVTTRVRSAAEARGRKFYIMYDISGWTDFQTGIKADWNDRIITKLHLTDSSAYAKQDGKPVVCIWGLGFLDRPGDAATSLDVVKFFKDKGVYVIGGVPPDWRTADGKRWGKTGFGGVYDALNAISPWMVGVIGDAAGSDGIRKERNEGDVAYCHARGIHYQPCVLPGDLQERQRKHGDFMWRQFANLVEIGSDGLYISMYDEYNEGNQIAKTAATSADKPSGSSFLTLDEDGTACSSDYYLRLTRDGGKMLKKQIAFTFTRPTAPK